MTIRLGFSQRFDDFDIKITIFHCSGIVHLLTTAEKWIIFKKLFIQT